MKRPCTGCSSSLLRSQPHATPKPARSPRLHEPKPLRRYLQHWPQRRSPIALVGIAATPHLEIIFDTLKTSRKYPNLLERPLCSLVIGWSGEQTLQLEGIAHEPHGETLKHFQEIYFAQWPECREHLSWPDIAFFVVRLNWARYSDYNQHPPFIQEVPITQEDVKET